MSKISVHSRLHAPEKVLSPSCKLTLVNTLRIDVIQVVRRKVDDEAFFVVSRIKPGFRNFKISNG